ncbi:MAG: hypothetical protein CVT98_06100 [Bacteroidetes bacterium HGW-Bacteroidetes-15]|nr:MAG: hypothetical protein CVT98_06100 [Bacteroidetes bacterium HGW-Bacteroidetes-15]
MLRWLSVFSLILNISLFSHANNLKLSNGSVNESSIVFDISWENSWNRILEGGNYDAIWIFAKGKAPSGLWEHIHLSSSPYNHSTDELLTIETVDDEKGIFIFPSINGTQNIPPTSVSISTIDNLSNYSEIRVYGIEMVGIPEGEFYFGDGASISAIGNNEGNPLLISSEQAIPSSNLSIINPNSQFEPQPLPTSIPIEYPKGFSFFYVMKYEISQVQYVDFLNTLTYYQQVNRTSSPPSSATGTFAMINPNQPDSLYRNGIVIELPGIPDNNPAVYAMDSNANSVFFDDNDGLHRAANFMNWADLSAYLDWAALRPITEMEYEKACRGTSNQPVAGEFAWGTNLITNANSPVNDGTLFEAVSEIPSSGSGLANHGNFVFTEGWGLRGVLRTGFAAKENSTRLEAGASYYGVMELSGNVWEQTIMIAADGEKFTGNFGDGQLAENGDANQPSWCNPSTAFGVLLKGGGWGSTISDVGSWRDLAVSDRFYSHIKPMSRRNTVGGRGGR